MTLYLKVQEKTEQFRIPTCSQCSVNWARLDADVPCERGETTCPRLEEPVLTPRLEYILQAYALQRIVNVPPRAGGQENQRPWVMQGFLMIQDWEAEISRREIAEMEHKSKSKTPRGAA